MLQTTIDIREKINTGVDEGVFSYLNLESPIGGQPGSALGTLVGNIFNLMLTFAAIFLIFYFIWAGFSWITSGGDKTKVEDARSRITNAIIGLAIVASTLALSRIVNLFFGTQVTIN